MIVGMDHVQVAMPVGGEGAAKLFYEGMLHLQVIEKPPALAQRGGVWFQCGAVQLHLGADPDFVPARKAHPAFAVDDLPTLLGELRARNVIIEPQETVNGRERVNLTDPFGNRVELIAGA
jgi:hypothetical protein